MLCTAKDILRMVALISDAMDQCGLYDNRDDAARELVSFELLMN